MLWYIHAYDYAQVSAVTYFIIGLCHVSQNVLLQLYMQHCMGSYSAVGAWRSRYIEYTQCNRNTVTLTAWRSICISLVWKQWLKDSWFWGGFWRAGLVQTELVNPEIRETLGFQFQKERQLKVWLYYRGNWLCEPKLAAISERCFNKAWD